MARKTRGTSTASKPRKPRKPRKSATKSRSKPKARANAKPIMSREGGKVALLSGGNPQIAKGEGDAPVQQYIAAMPGWKREIGKRLDALIVRNVPQVRKAVKWNSPFYGIEGEGWFLSFHVFTRYVKVTFFRGTSLRRGAATSSPFRATQFPPDSRLLAGCSSQMGECVRGGLKSVAARTEAYRDRCSSRPQCMC
jgi:hypothetical protein